MSLRAQIEEKHYIDPFIADDKKVVYVGVNFAPKTHNVESVIK